MPRTKPLTSEYDKLRERFPKAGYLTLTDIMDYLRVNDRHTAGKMVKGMQYRQNGKTRLYSMDDVAIMISRL